MQVAMARKVKTAFENYDRKIAKQNETITLQSQIIAELQKRDETKKSKSGRLKVPKKVKVSLRSVANGQSLPSQRQKQFTKHSCLV